MTNTERLLEHAAHYAGTSWVAPQTPVPSLEVTVVACMDARIDVFAMFGLSVGQAHVIRNAGGTVTDDTLRSLTISQRFLGTKEVILVHHTNCGMQGFTDEEFTDELERETGQRPSWSPGAFTDPAEDIRLSAARIRDCVFLPSRHMVRGFIFDVTTGRLDEVELP